MVPLDPARCPDCTTPVEAGSWAQPTLVRHGGYGGAARTTIRWCPDCHWVLEAAVETVR